MQTTQWICVDKDYDKHRKFTKCLLENTITGEQEWIDKDVLKKAIKNGRRKVVNLDVNDANRLIDISGINTNVSKRAQSILSNLILDLSTKLKQKFRKIVIKSKKNKLSAKESIIASSLIEIKYGTMVYQVNIFILQNGKYVVSDEFGNVTLFYKDEVIEKIYKNISYLILRYDAIENF